MALNISHSIDILFNGIDNVSKDVDGIANKIGGMASGVGDVAAPFADLAEKILLVEGALAAVGVAILKSKSEIEGETRGMSAALDIPLEKAKELEPVFRSLYNDTFADSMAEGADAVQLAFQKFGDIGTEGLESMTKKALALGKTFEADLGGSLGAAKTLMENFGLSGDEAMDFITAGMQQGLNGSDDFLESINEYSTQFANGGATAEQFFSVMQSGYQEGVLGTDKAADAFKEFRVRIQDGSTATSDALALIGIDAASLGDKMASGTVTAAQAFEMVIGKLNETKDANTVMQAGVGLMGSQFEDLGTKASLNLSLTSTKMDELIGKSGELSDKVAEINPFEKMWRALTAEVQDLPVWDKFFDEAKETVSRVADILPEAFDGVDLSGLEGSLAELENIIKGFFGDADITTVEGLREIIQQVIDTVTSFQETANGVIGAWTPFFDFVKGMIKAYNDLDSGTKETIGNLLGIAQQVTIVAGGVAAAAAAVPALTTAFSGLASVAAVLAGPVGLVGVAAAAGAMAGDLIRTDWLDNQVQGFYGWVDSLISTDEAIAGTVDSTESLKKKLDDTAGAVGGVKDATDEMAGKLAGVDAELSDFFSDIDGYSPVVGLSVEDFKAGVDEIDEYFDANISDKEVETSATVDYTSVEKARGWIEETLPDGTREIIWIGDVDKPSVEKSKADIEAIVPPEKQLRIMADIDIAKIKEQSAIVQKSVEWQAKLDIANVEANAKIVQSQFESISNTISSTGDVISSVFGVLAGLGDSVSDVQKRWLIEEQLEKENELRAAALELQKETARVQNEYLKAKTDMMKSGKGMMNITIDGTSLEADLRSMTNTLLAYVQMQANQEGLEALLGL